MATAAAGSKRAYKQDLPPKGGYRPFNYERIPARKMYTGLYKSIIKSLRVVTIIIAPKTRTN